MERNEPLLVLPRWRRLVVLTLLGHGLLTACDGNDGADPQEDASVPSCGDGLVEGDEQCDDGNDIAWDGCTACRISEFRITDERPGLYLDPAIALRRDTGEFAVAWSAEEPDGFLRSVWFRQFEATGEPVGDELRLSPGSGGDHRAPDLAVNASGEYLVVWQASTTDGSPLGIAARGVSAAGVPDVTERMLSTQVSSNPGRPSLALAPDGRHVVAWLSSDESLDATIYLRRFDAAGVAEGPEVFVDDGGCSDPHVALAGDGRILVTYTGWGWDGYLGGIYVAVDVGSGFPHPNIPRERVNQQTDGDQGKPAIAMLADGTSVLVWQSELTNSETRRDIRAVRLPADWMVGPMGLIEIQVSERTEGWRAEPSVAIASVDRWVAVWEWQVDLDGGIQGAWFGSPAGAKVQVSTPVGMGGLGTRYPVVAASDDGHFVVVWMARDHYRDSVSLHAQRFDPLGVPLGRW
jgi:cysteine-rich repeat protein